MSNIYDVAIVGMGVAGAFAATKIAKEHRGIKLLSIDLGRRWAKRRHQVSGFLGCLPSSDGKLYLNDIDKIYNIVDGRRVKASINWFNNFLSNVNDFKTIKDKSPTLAMEKKLLKNNYKLELNNYIQMYPKDVHILSKHMAEIIENNKNISYSFDNEVTNIFKVKNIFHITTENQEYKCKKVIIAVGRSGWRWAKTLYNNFGIIDNNDISKFGIRVEVNSSVMKDFNKSNCTLTKDNIEIGPLSWYGTVIPEDHTDLTISAFRSNENRWKTDKVSFNLIGSQSFPNKGCEQTDRLGRLTFVLSNDRILKEKLSYILNDKSKISIIPEYNWLKEAITQFSSVVPEIINKGYFHVPTIIPTVPNINIGTNLESEVDGMFIVGESAGVHGILAAGLMGIAAADSVCK